MKQIMLLEPFREVAKQLEMVAKELAVGPAAQRSRRVPFGRLRGGVGSRIPTRHVLRRVPWIVRNEFVAIS